jgi:NAD(P)-dependent dehydrogenase (short-subunit alcohol dehydrogenase family)
MLQAFFCERAIIRRMLRQNRGHAGGCRGSIVVVTSQLAELTCPGMTAYSATKAGVRGMCRSDAMDYGPEGIRINTVGPGPTVTPLLLASQNSDFIAHMALATPLRRNAEPEDIANAIVWLSSDRASFITGVSLMVDGGNGLEVGPD